MQTTGNAGTLQRLVGAVLLTDSHQTRHLNLGELDLPATEGSQGLCKDRLGTGHVEEDGGALTMSATLNF